MVFSGLRREVICLAYRMGNWKLAVIFLTCALVAGGILPLLSSQANISTTLTVLSEGKLEYSPETDIPINQESLNSSSTNPSTALPTPAPTPTVTSTITPTPLNTVTADPTPANYNLNEVFASPSPIPMPSDNSRELKASIDALGKMGGEIVLQSDLFLSDIDVSVPSNIVLRGVDSTVTLHLISKRLNVAVNASNVIIKNLTIDASDLGDRNLFAIYSGARNVTLTDITFQNHFSNKTAIVSLGSNVTLSNLVFSNLTIAYPIQVAGSYSIIKNCSSSDPSTYGLITMGGGISNVIIEQCVAENRPLFNGGYTPVSSSDLWIVNNTLINFPKWTYGILIEGGAGNSTQAPYNRVYVLDNKIVSGVLTYNAIAIYGLSSNVLVANNTVDQQLSRHNAIGISSGVNVTVTQNTVYGCTENTEGGIEVESNPVHNRLIGISENVTVTKNLVFNSTWGIYVRIMVPNHENWAGNPLPSKNILIEGNMVHNCPVGINLLHGENIVVKNNVIDNNTVPFAVNNSSVINYRLSGNVGCSDYSP
jgi:parallel beta-helix repeat protein